LSGPYSGFNYRRHERPPQLVAYGTKTSKVTSGASGQRVPYSIAEAGPYKHRIFCSVFLGIVNFRVKAIFEDLRRIEGEYSD
jgi:hypothetical protein